MKHLWEKVHGRIRVPKTKWVILRYPTPSMAQLAAMSTDRDLRLEFLSGKIVKDAANDTERINQILDSDEGARYIGEFAIGVNLRSPGR